MTTEKLYHVLDSDGRLMMRKYGDNIKRVFANTKVSEYPKWQKVNLELSEKEIKEYDPRFWPFAEEVKEQ